MLKDIEQYIREYRHLFVRQLRTKSRRFAQTGDTAMYAAKKSGRNTLRFFDPACRQRWKFAVSSKPG